MIVAGDSEVLVMFVTPNGEGTARNISKIKLEGWKKKVKEEIGQLLLAYI